ncbi:hypothetical protein CRUP_018681 [Coryphaenoides rupestris]|nr:hypothetical protein CRUP_018681 [Coryphaenoides rupestris]
MMQDIQAAEQRRLEEEATAFERMMRAQRETDERRFQALQAQQQASNQMLLQLVSTLANDEGDHFPIWGTCQGFQQLSVITANKNLLTITDTVSVTLPLTFTKAAQSSQMFQRFPADLLQSLSEENITSNFHRWSLSLQVLSTNTDGNVDFISTMEAYRYPFYAVQWHPEKSPFEWVA